MSFHGPFNLQGAAQTLYENAARRAPIYDYHCHLSPKEICEDVQFADVGQMMLSGDHYKWRAMRYAGHPERAITGDAAWLEKFTAWMDTCERLVGSPLQAWTRLELQTFFKIDLVPNREHARAIYDACNQAIREHLLSPRKIMNAMNVRAVCTTDDPVDSLEYHKRIAEDDSMTCKVLPTFRPDAALKIQDIEFGKYIGRLGEKVQFSINSFTELVAALEKRLLHFRRHGCIFSDHSLEHSELAAADEETVEKIFSDALAGNRVSDGNAAKFRLRLLCELGRMYADNGIAMQLHIGAKRNVNSGALAALGADAGYDVPNDFRVAEPIAVLLNAMESDGALPRVLLYTLHPKDYQVLAPLCSAFTQAGIPGKVQLGPAWWHCDTEKGMLEQLEYAGNFGLLSSFWGMLTDSRSFLSYTRHDYFRRILCFYIGNLKDGGTYQGEYDTLEKLVSDVCFGNVARFIDAG